MEDIPQPPDNPLEVGDRVQIYIDNADPDARFHGIVCEVVEVLTDDLGAATGRSTDAYSYILRNVETDTQLPISFRHRDLVLPEGEQRNSE